ncbi:MAG: SRPBCC family protein [Xenococcaceae cyanobacterium]
MSKTDDLQPKSNFSTTTSNFKTELELETSNSADSVIQSAVDIKIEKLEERQRRVFAKIQIPYSLEEVWQVLTDYESFPEFMPSLIQSRRLDRPNGGLRIEQVRTKNFMGMNFSARSVFDIEEKFPHEIHYQLIEGDMKAFSGHWRLEPSSLFESKAGIDLIFDFFLSPKRIFPIALVEHMLSQNIPANMLAISQRVEEIFG